MFESLSVGAKVGYVDAHWSLTRFGGSRLDSAEFKFRLSKTSARRFEHTLRYSDIEPSLRFGNGDILRYFFTYWVMPDEGIQGIDCTTDVAWFANAANTLPDRGETTSTDGHTGEI